jgi:hypothetical protein
MPSSEVASPVQLHHQRIQAAATKRFSDAGAIAHQADTNLDLPLHDTI